MTTALSFLPFFNIKKRHYIFPPVIACNPFQSLPSSTTGGVVEMLLLVGTPFFKFVFSGSFKKELELCCSYNFNPFHRDYKGGFPYRCWVETFSISNFSAFFSLISQLPLQILNFLPSVLYKCEGRR